MDLAKKRQSEQQMMAKMMRLYCRGQGHGAAKGSLCPHCAQLLDYANQRTARCPRMAEKTFCSKCPHPCYQPQQRQEIRAVMRYAGPRMLYRSPVLVLRHMLAPKARPAKQPEAANNAGRNAT